MYAADGDYSNAKVELAKVAVGAVTNSVMGKALKASKQAGLMSTAKQEVVQETALGAVGNAANKSIEKVIDVKK